MNTKVVDPVSIKFFLAVAETGSIAKAAARESVVPSAVSKRLTELEGHFDVKLLDRGARGVTLTPAGDALLYHSRTIVQAMDRLHGDLFEYAKGVRGRIKIQASFSSICSPLPHDLQRFSQSNPSIKLELEENVTPLIFKAVEDGECDLGIAPMFDAPATLQLLPYREFKMAAVMPQNHALAGRERLSYKELLAFEQVELCHGSAMAAVLDRASTITQHVTKRVFMRVHSYESICRLVAGSMGVGIVPMFFSRTHAATYGLKFVPLLDEWANSTIAIALRKDSVLPLAARILIDHLRQQSGAIAEQTGPICD